MSDSLNNSSYAENEKNSIQEANSPNLSNQKQNLDISIQINSDAEIPKDSKENPEELNKSRNFLAPEPVSPSQMHPIVRSGSKRVLKPRQSVFKLEGESMVLEEQSPKYSKAIFSSSLKLPQIETRKTHDFYRRQFDEKKGLKSSKSSLKLSKIPGYKTEIKTLLPFDLNKRNRKMRHKKQNFDVASLEDKYRTQNVLSNSLKLTTDLYYHLTQVRNQDNIFFDDIDKAEVEQSRESEKEYLKSQLTHIKSLPAIDKGSKDVVGLKAVKNFYRHYKILEKVEDQNKMTNTKTSVYTKILKSESKKKLLPLKMNIIKVSGNPSKINCQ